MAGKDAFTYVKPKAGTTAFLKMNFDMPSEEFCVELLRSKSVMLVPGKAFDMEGFFRIGYANNPKIVKTGLEKISEFVEKLKNSRSYLRFNV